MQTAKIVTIVIPVAVIALLVRCCCGFCLASDKVHYWDWHFLTIPAEL